MSRPKHRGRKWKRDEATERVLREHRAIEDQADRPSAPPAAPQADPAPPEEVIVPGPSWPHRSILSQHRVYHPAPGALPGSTRRPCPSCGTYKLWDPNNEAYGPHTIEQCDWNQERNARQEERERNQLTAQRWWIGF